MKLKKLILFGFKSFADKTTLEFQPGLTAIVGPNGCGKSNVVDALRWVMGETQAKAIRGEKMFDVLFNGTKTRPKTSYAEVSLVFDEIGEALPVPYEEVMVTRRLFADGQSAYFLNKKEVRLKDIHTLFANTGIGKNAFWVFEQGKIDQIVTMSPLELRTIFEDASGISLYLTQKKEAKSRLKEVEQNLLRAGDRIAEKEKFIALLRKQKEEAENYKIIKNDLEVHEKGYFYKRLKQIETKIEELSHHQLEVKSHLTELEASLREKERALKRGEALQQTIQEEKEEKKELLYKLRNEIALLEQKRHQLNREMQQKQERKASLKNSLALLETEIALFKKTYPEKSEQLHALHSALESKQAVYQEEKLGKSALEQEVQTASKRERTLQEGQFTLQKAIQKGQFDLKTLELKKENCLKEKEGIESSFSTLSESIVARTLKTHRQQEELQSLQKEFELIKGSLKEKQQELLEQNRAIGEFEKQIQEAQKKYTEIQTKISALQSLKNELDGASLGTKDLFKAFPEGLKPLSELLEIETDQAEMIANALHPYSHTLVAKSEELLNAALDYIKTHQLTNISLTLDGTDRFFQDIHFYNTVGEVESTPAWTKDGFWVTSKRLITRTKMGEHNAFVREGEIKKLQKEQQTPINDKENLELKKQESLVIKETLQQQLEEIEARLKNKETLLMELKYHLQNELSELKKEEAQKIALKSKIDSLDQQLLPLDRHKSELENLIGAHEKQLQEMNDELQTISSTLEKGKNELNHRNNTLQAHEKELFSLISTKEKMKGEIQSNEYRHQQQLKAKGEIEAEWSQIEKFLTEGGASLENETLAALKENLIDLEHSHKQKLFMFEEMAKDLIVLKSDFTRFSQESTLLSDQLKTLEMKLFEQGVKKEALKKELFEKYNLEEVEPPPFELSFDKYESKIKSLRETLSLLPSINPLAQDEHAHEEKELIELQKQIGDLNLSMVEVKKLITDLDEKSTTLFHETFRTVAHHFQKNFQTLFNGGHAELMLKESQDLLETEVEIHCEPPGKSLKSLQLLSGGEKCLTAIALLFALFQVKPAPMCLLDEIDAPLDESNARRFLDLIKPFASETKIILVTHNKMTMERAEQLIGISMQEKGVTKVIDLVSLEAAVCET